MSPEAEGRVLDPGRGGSTNRAGEDSDQGDDAEIQCDREYKLDPSHHASSFSVPRGLLERTGAGPADGKNWLGADSNGRHVT